MNLFAKSICFVALLWGALMHGSLLCAVGGTLLFFQMLEEDL